MKKKIVIIMPELHFGGAETQFRYLIEYIDKKKFEIIVIIERTYMEELSVDDKEYMGRHPDIEFIILSTKVTKGYSHKTTYLLSKEIKKELKRIHADIAVVYTYTALRALPWIKNGFTKFIFSERNTGQFLQQLSFYNKHIVMKVPKLFVCNSSFSAKIYREHEYNTKLIYNGVRITDTDIINNRYTDDSNFFEILIPARITTVKNQLLAIEALKQLNDPNIKLILIGKIEDKDYYDLILQKVNEYNLKNQVEIRSFDPNIASLFQRVSLVLLPSLQEGLANVVLESYKYGVLCLASDIPMNVDVVPEKRCLFKSNDVDSLVDKIKELHIVPSKDKQSIIEQNHRFLVGNFSIQKMVQSYEELFYEM